MWDTPIYQQAEWDKFKQHPAFYLGATITDQRAGALNNTVLPLIQFSK